jgi:hypothetical protein
VHNNNTINEQYTDQEWKNLFVCYPAILIDLKNATTTAGKPGGLYKTGENKHRKLGRTAEDGRRQKPQKNCRTL